MRHPAAQSADGERQPDEKRELRRDLGPRRRARRRRLAPDREGREPGWFKRRRSPGHGSGARRRKRRRPVWPRSSNALSLGATQVRIDRREARSGSTGGGRGRATFGLAARRRRLEVPRLRGPDFPHPQLAEHRVVESHVAAVSALVEQPAEFLGTGLAEVELRHDHRSRSCRLAAGGALMNASGRALRRPVGFDPRTTHALRHRSGSQIPPRVQSARGSLPRCWHRGWMVSPRSTIATCSAILAARFSGERAWRTR